jgi:hypothetical protein
MGRGYWSIFVLVGLSQLVGGSWQPLTSAMMARLAGANGRHALNLAYTLSMSGMMLVAPAIGALLLPVAGPVPLVSGDAVSFLVGAALFASLPAMPGLGRGSLTVRSAATGGFAAVYRRPVLRIVALGAFSSTLVITALQASLPDLAAQRFGSSADAGFCWAAVGLGGIIGSLIALWRPLQRPAVILPAIVGEILCIGAVALAGGPAIDLILLAGNTASASLAQIEGGVVIQSQARDTVARVQSAVSTSRFLGMAGGAALALVLALTVTWQALVVLLAVLGLVLMAGAALGPSGTAAAAADAARPASPLAGIPD